MTQRLTRRALLRLAGATAATGMTAPRFLRAIIPAKPRGCFSGEPTAQKVGEQVLADGGNAFDAVVAGALAAGMAVPYQFCVGGYGGFATLVAEGGKKIVSLDFNTMAPAGATPGMFTPHKDKVQPIDNSHGWRAAGVPGILAGLQLLLDRYGTLRFADVVKPAIQLAREGVRVETAFAFVLTRCAGQFARDPASKKLYLKDGKPLGTGELFCNPELADMLATLAQRGSVESFYRGDIASRIADGFQKNGGLVTARDLAAYQAREVKPLTLTWGERTIHTAPLTAGGLTTLEALRMLGALRWNRMPHTLARTQSWVEALRLAWRDRLTLLGDPEAGKVPSARLLSEEHARECAARIEAAVKAGTPLTHPLTPRPQGGTINLSAADEKGNFVAITLTHGESFGARVTVPGLGLTLGHGMSRFDTEPAHPNAPGPGKRPLTNMCPSIVTQRGRPILAVGGRGGRKIPSALFEVLTQFVVLERPLAEAIAAPRLHTEGSTSVEVEKAWPEAETTELRKLGYAVKTGTSATISAVADVQGELVPGMR